MKYQNKEEGLAPKLPQEFLSEAGLAPEILPLEYGAGRDIYITSRDGRDLAVHAMGPEDGDPILFLGGNPSSRFGPHLAQSQLTKRGIRLYACERTGFGDSTRNPSASVGDAAKDIEDIADHLRIGRFALVGRSGGSPIAMAGAAHLQDRVSGLVLMAPLAPPHALEEWTQGMSPENKESYTAAVENPSAVYAKHERIADELLEDFYSHMLTLEPGLAVGDLFWVTRALLEGIARGHAHGAASRKGWPDAIMALRRPWEFEVESITTPTILWHGDLDPFVDVEHSRWLYRHIPNALFYEDREAAHFTLLAFVAGALKEAQDLHLGQHGIFHGNGGRADDGIAELRAIFHSGVPDDDDYPVITWSPTNYYSAQSSKPPEASDL